MKLSRVLALVLLAAPFTPLSRAEEPPAGVELLLNQSYRPGDEHWRLDLARPVDRTGRLPAVLVIHGGGWRDGDKNGEHSVMTKFAQAGYVGISVGYRLIGTAPFPACIDDCVAALRWVRANADRLGIDPARIGGYGHSAGGHLVCMLGLAEPGGHFAPGYLEAYAAPLAAVCGSSAPTDLAGWERDQGEAGLSRLLFGNLPPEEVASRERRDSPLSYVSPNAPPFFLLHGASDRTVPPAQSARLWKALRQAGAPLEERVVYDGAVHDWILSYESLYWPQVLSFFDTTIGPRSGQLRPELAAGDSFRKLGGDRRKVVAWLRQFDRDGDGFVSRAEFPGSDRLFERLGGLRQGKIPLPSP